MADERHDQTEEQRTVARRPPITDTMEDFWRPVIQEEYSAIRQPTVDANRVYRNKMGVGMTWLRSLPNCQHQPILT